MSFQNWKTLKIIIFPFLSKCVFVIQSSETLIHKYSTFYILTYRKYCICVVSYPVWLCTTSETLSLRWHLRIAVLQCLGKEGQLFSLFCFIPTISPSFFNYFLQECFPLNKITFLFKKNHSFKYYSRLWIENGKESRKVPALKELTFLCPTLVPSHQSSLTFTHQIYFCSVFSFFQKDKSPNIIFILLQPQMLLVLVSCENARQTLG